MTVKTAACTAVLALALALPFSSAHADDGLRHDMSEVRAELDEAMDRVRGFGADAREDAVETLRDGLERADAETDRLEAAIRDGWADMSEDTREEAAEIMHELRRARLDMAERLGRMEHVASDGWEGVRDEFGEAWSRFSAAWVESDPLHRHED